MVYALHGAFCSGGEHSRCLVVILRCYLFVKSSMELIGQSSQRVMHQSDVSTSLSQLLFQLQLCSTGPTLAAF